MRKKLVRFFIFISIALFGLMLLPSSTVDADQELTANEKVNALFTKYYHEGRYTKNTVINLTEVAQKELTQHFHAQSNILVRTTHYSPDALWMSRGPETEGVKYSYYGTHYTDNVADGVTNATAYEPYVTPTDASIVLSGEGQNSMEEYYTTLLDLIESNAEWTVDGNGYSTTDETILQYFLDFTAPCLYNTVVTSNYFTYHKASVEEINHELVLKLWVDTENYGAINNYIEKAPNVLSQATIGSHSYSDEWNVVKNATLYEDGLKARTCACGDQITEIIPASADFRRDFTLDNSNGTWKYAAVEEAWLDNFGFTPLADKNSDTWLGDGREIKAGWINASGAVGIAYEIEEDIHVNIDVTFFGETDLTRLSLRIAVKNSEGVIYLPITFDIMDKNTTNINKYYSLKAGDVVYFLFSNENWQNIDAYPNGYLDIKLTPKNIVADFAKDFTLDSSNGTWKYSMIEYNWGTEDFVANPLFEKIDDGWKNGQSEVKAGWIFAGWMVGVGYTANQDIKGKVVVNFDGDADDTSVALRMAVKNSEGVLYARPSYDKIINTATIVFDYELKAGDTIYFIFSNEAAEENAKGALNISIYAE